MCLYFWRHTMHGGSVLVDYLRSVLRKTPMTHIWHKVLTKRNIGNIWERRSNGTYDFVYLVSTIVKSAVDERLINQKGVWDGSSDVRCKNWVRNGEVIRTRGFGVVLLSVWTWWGAWVHGNVFLRRLNDLLSEKGEEWRLVLAGQN